MFQTNSQIKYRGALKFSHHPILWVNIEQKIENVKVIKILYDFFVGW